MTVLHIQILNNSVQQYLLFVAIFLGLSLGIKEGGNFIANRLGKIARFKDFIDQETIDKGRQLISPILYTGVFYFALNQLVLNAAVNQTVRSLLVIVFCIQTIRFLLFLSTYLLEKTWFRRHIDNPDLDISKSVLSIVRLLIWGLGLIFLLNNLGFNVSAIIAGLGIGGIAVALAGQTILGDLFNYFVILLDRPFREGDFIVAENFMGTIENIGIKSTRLRALGGEELVISNTNLISSRIHNFKRMNARRIEFSVTASHAASSEQLKDLPAVIAKIIQNIPDTKLDRSHFKAITDSGHVLEAVYFVMHSDYNKYMDIQQSINFGIKKAFEERKIDFAGMSLMIRNRGDLKKES